MSRDLRRARTSGNRLSTEGYRAVGMASILLVADDEWVRNDVEASLKDPNITLTVETDPRAVAGLVREQSFDWAIVDLQIGSMGGMAVVRMLRTAILASETADMGIVLLLDRDADRFLAARAGADASIVKPFTAQQLRGQLAASTG
jgi:DNA-binding response OmpR family regulator